MRLLEILFYLLKCNSKTTIKELANRFNVSQKTIQRDLDKLSVLGIPIISYRGVNGGIELDKNYIIAKYVLTENDYRDLILSLYISEQVIDDLKKSDLIDKFKLINYDKCTEILDKLEDRFIVDLDDRNRVINNEVCKIIDKALDKKTYVKLEIKEKNIEVFPISYVLKKEGLYLYCYDDKYKLILIDNICNATDCERVFNGEIVKYKDNKDEIIIT
ncbi:HTH domain-containing protein [Clostridium sp. NSJ-49]|jgi:predicted DNA-binding transcriptional regulator YafY|uniref:Helix-turn-helix type 11 domain-containing protein n=1 Tax=Clostridium disporicum TaxID=84024 RepID=A0A174H3P7_9CLOT|nr:MULTISPECIES: HTH domain-containing protein [Clostridium]MBC5627176.1 HTH domain-containing protein [Clostridium sp. NSJ-49]MCD2500902.1 HTH domain-containing protein [Clostridium sp. NSJ-145]MDU6340314.1 HTH domain-containing protein [Clostridium sp.]CUO68871.1 helix-turn-helix type 11 domain-containing protein [Clostridium disporicum]